MAKRLTVFYSWQSDSPSNLNRNFIEKALLEALKRLHSNATLENALRDTTVELDNYLIFSQSHLKSSPPLQIEAGLIGIRKYPIAVDNNGFRGKALQDAIRWQNEIAAYGKPAWEILGPFFDLVWSNCGIQRTSQDQAALIKKFTG